MHVIIPIFDLETFLLSFVAAEFPFFKCIFQDPTLADELGDNLIRTGTDLFTNSRFKEAAEYFTEVIRLVCKFNFVRDAYVYQAKCHVKLVSSMIKKVKSGKVCIRAKWTRGRSLSRFL